MKRAIREHAPLLLTALLLYGAALIYQGYTYGTGDQSQIMPVLLAQDQPGLYPHDHYVQSYLNAGVNERTIFHILWRYLGYGNPWITFILHATAGIGLLLAWLRICDLFLQRSFYRALVTGTIVTLAVHVSLGGNELYYNSFIPSLAAKAVASWGLYYWLRSRFTLWGVLLLIAGLLQPLVGLQLFLITLVAELVSTFRRKAWTSFPWKPAAVYIGVTAPWIILLALGNGAGGDDRAFMEIMSFRLSHHFFPGTWPLTAFALTIILAAWSISAFPDKLKYFLVAIVAGCLLYMVILAKFDHPVVLYTQWFKTTIWLEAFGLIAIARTAERLTYYYKFFRHAGMLVPVLFVGLAGLYRHNQAPEQRPAYMFPWVSTEDAEVRISRRAAERTPADAVFVVPYSFTAFRWYAQRSLYVDYKAMLHQQPFLGEWYARIQVIYQYGKTEQEAGFGFANFADAVLDEPAYETLVLWHKLGITHFISRASSIEGLEPLATEPPYTLYAVPVP